MTEPTEPTAAPFEQLLDRLGQIAAQLEGDEVPLEQALRLFEEGTKLGKAGHRRLDEAERRLELLQHDGQVAPLPPPQPTDP